MGAPTVLLSLCCLCLVVVRSESGRMFAMYTDRAPVSMDPLDVIAATSKPLRCHGACVRRPDCVAFWISSSNCSLYGSFVDDPDSQLQMQTGDVFFNIGKGEDLPCGQCACEGVCVCVCVCVCEGVCV